MQKPIISAFRLLSNTFLSIGVHLYETEEHPGHLNFVLKFRLKTATAMLSNV